MRIFVAMCVFVMSSEKIKPRRRTSESVELPRELVLFNDDHNTFDFVIGTLIEVCEHDPQQAEQCALIAHFKGKCAVKSGSFSELRPPCEEMLLRGLTVEIH
jgi:ATP-dependent Clp protease adaptor protein ClpS